ncbi:hypothetical protein Val02_39690 [Virgisporangium aliadipatigenens]|uniref:YtxH domain-containing protein n=1 Tax=Virgisporangium aliadipatigenens TaxID=741659 RepID=A0A8J4DRT0_9ACTN|nr:hypothetical protein [Virgisporangium aliadipatigenens]GIJ47083.1 hypothetical protein Val02_39690 [Virgisporangium aliadipatigenens]
MRGKLLFLGGLAAGFVLGSRAGREKYEEIVSKARQLQEHPTVQEARGVVQEQANKLFTEGKDRLSQSKLAETRVGEKLLNSDSSSTGSSGTESLATASTAPRSTTTASTTTPRSTTSSSSVNGTTGSGY